MKNDISRINPGKEIEKIVGFIRGTFKDQGIQKAVVGVSGGIDSATSLYLAAQALGAQNVIAVHMPYFTNHLDDFYLIVASVKIPKKNVNIISIKKLTDVATKTFGIDVEQDAIRFGNIAARMRMITLFDIAKRESALVVGTENKTEHFLSYFTRFGDEASDIEPILHLYKTQVYSLAKYLKIPERIIVKPPTAGLWAGQTDEGEFGFTYQEADIVLFLHFEKKMPIREIEKKYKDTKKIIKRVTDNEYKHKVPYKM